VRVTAAAERISARDLHQRIALDGPDDELRRLADTFDGLLARLEASFDSQRRFIANASHELRTPLAIQRTALQVGLRPDDPDGVARTRDQLLDANRRSDALIESLLVLATSERGLRERESCDLHVIVAETVASRGEMARERGLTLTADAGPCVVGGDAVLLGQLVANLVDNALEYNAAGGHVAVTLTADRLSIANTGPLVAPDAVDGLFEPFRRGDGDRRHGRGHHSGLGLSIVAAIVAAHGMSLSARAPASGGLVVDIALGDSRLPAPTIVG
jgi:signal transduction histidine kinase